MAENNEEKDFMDFELDDPLASVEPLAAPVRQAERAEPTGTGVLLYEGKKYAVNLSWLVADEGGNSVLALKRAKGFGADFYCMRSNVVAQHGFGYLSMGHRINMPALASVVADVFVGEWHGVFAADNGWWYVAVHADNIAPRGDLFFTSEEEAYNFFVQEAKAYRWPRSYAPTGWNLNEATSEIPLNKIIDEGTPPVLKPVTTDAIFSGRRNRNLAIVGVFVLILLLIAGVLGQQFLPALIPSRATVPMPDLQVGDVLQAPPEEPVLIAEREADNLSRIPLLPADQFVTLCLANMSAISKAVPGWTLNILRCRDTFVEGNWARGVGSTEMAVQYLEDFPQGSQTKFLDASTLQVQRPMPKVDTGGQTRPLAEKNRVMLLLGNRFNALGQLETKDVVPVASQQLLQGVAAMQQADSTNTMQNVPAIKPLMTYNDLPYVSVILTTKTPPNLLVKYFNIPGMVLEEINGQITQGVWRYEGRVILTPDKNLVEANMKARAMMRSQ